MAERDSESLQAARPRADSRPHIERDSETMRCARLDVTALRAARPPREVTFEPSRDSWTPSRDSWAPGRDSWTPLAPPPPPPPAAFQPWELDATPVPTLRAFEEAGASKLVATRAASILDGVGSSRERGDAERAKRTCLGGVRIVVVDDDEDARDLLCTVLVQRGATVTYASCAADAFELVKRELPDVLVSDIAMPGEDGFTLVGRVRALPSSEGGATRCVAVTAYASASDRRRALEAGFDGWLPKPLDHDALTSLLLELRAR